MYIYILIHSELSFLNSQHWQDNIERLFLCIVLWIHLFAIGLVFYMFGLVWWFPSGIFLVFGGWHAWISHLVIYQVLVLCCFSNVLSFCWVLVLVAFSGFLQLLLWVVSFFYFVCDVISPVLVFYINFAMCTVPPPPLISVSICSFNTFLLSMYFSRVTVLLGLVFFYFYLKFFFFFFFLSESFSFIRFLTFFCQCYSFWLSKSFFYCVNNILV